MVLMVPRYQVLQKLQRYQEPTFITILIIN